MTKKQKWYVVTAGYDKKKDIKIEHQVFDNWDDVQPLVTDVSKKKNGVAPVYKSFSSLEEAIQFNEENKGRSTINVSPNALHCFVDGSCSQDGTKYGTGIVYAHNGMIVKTESIPGTNSSATSERQIAGELSGAMRVCQYALKNGYQEVVIYHDYAGVANHATGAWKRKTDIAKAYYEWMQNFFQKHPKIHISFGKVHGHMLTIKKVKEDDLFEQECNELADGLAKKAVGLEPSRIFLAIHKKYSDRGILL